MTATYALDIGIGGMEDVVPLSDPKWASLWAISEEFAWFGFSFFIFFFVSFGVWHDLNCGLTWKCLVCGRKLVIPTCAKGSFWQMMSWRNELRPDLPARPWL